MEIYKGALHFQRRSTIKKVEVVLCVLKLFVPRGILHYIPFILRLIPDILQELQPSCRETMLALGFVILGMLRNLLC